MSKKKREYKSSIFSMLLEDKHNALETFNALNGTNYNNVDDLEIHILENAIYLSFRNDASFIIAANLNIYEHQSTYNPNMPLRDLIYVSNLFADLVKDENLYGTKIIKIPTPRFVTFYNGIVDMPEQMVLKLSDSYENITDNPELELKCTFINLNKGNKEFLDKCSVMREYTFFVDKVRMYNIKNALGEAIDMAIDDCIENHILEDFLKMQKARVKSMSVLEFNLEKQLKFEREEGWEDGCEAGSCMKLISLVCKKLSKGKNPQVIAEELEENYDEINRICQAASKYAPDYNIEKIYNEIRIN